MKFPTVALVSAILVSVFAVGQSGVISDAPLDQAQPYFIDGIVKAIIESLRPKLASLKIGDINEIFSSPALNGSINVRGIRIQGIDQFAIQNIKSTLLPLRLTNLTLLWDKISVDAGYDIDLVLGVPQLSNPIRLFAKGDASVALDKLFFTVGANIELKDKAIQIKRRGLFGFDLSVQSVKVSLSSLMGSTEFGSSLGAFLSKVLPELIDVLKKPVFDVFQDDIVNIINDLLNQNPSKFLLDNYQDLQELNSYETANELDSAFGPPLDLGLNFDDDEFNLIFN